MPIDAQDLRDLRRLVECDQVVSEFASTGTTALSTSRVSVEVAPVPPTYGNLRQIHIDLTSVAGGATKATIELAKGASAAASVIVTNSVTADILPNFAGSTWVVNVAFPPSPIWLDYAGGDRYFVLITLDAGTATATKTTLIANCFATGRVVVTQ